MKTEPNEPITPFTDIEGRIASNVDMKHLDGMGAMIGLTKREYFAGIAMQGLLCYNYSDNDGNAIRAVQQADALIRQLNSALEFPVIPAHSDDDDDLPW